MLENGVVRTPTGFKAAFDALREGGWTALDCDPDYGGQGLPYLMHTAVGEMFVSANMAFNMYQGLTHGAYSAIHAHGTDDAEGDVAAEDGHLRMDRHDEPDRTALRHRSGADADQGRTAGRRQLPITGQKIFISAGEHDMADEHHPPGAGQGPGRRRGHQGHLALHRAEVPGERRRHAWARATRCPVGKIEEKMGIHGNATCVMNYDGATGWLLGDLHKGMRAMFTMMNEARLGVGLQGYAVAEAAYQNALAYAKDRLQGRAVTGVEEPRRPRRPADRAPRHPPQPDGAEKLRRRRARLDLLGRAR